MPTAWQHLLCVITGYYGMEFGCASLAFAFEIRPSNGPTTPNCQLPAPKRLVQDQCHLVACLSHTVPRAIRSSRAAAFAS